MTVLLQKISISILLTLFVMYSSSVSVVWMLYFYEKQDVIMYYCPYDAETGGNGMGYVQRLLDGSSQSHAHTIISPLDNVPSILEKNDITFKPNISLLFRKEYSSNPQLGFSPELLRPPMA